MSASPLRRAWALCAAALLALAAPAAAQAVIGELVERTTGAPVGGAVVVLLDAEGAQRASALTGPTGVFALRAPGPGTYRLRAERVGYASTLSPPLELAAGQTIRHRLVSAEAAVRLDALAATGTRRGCRVRPGAGEATAALWEEARKALNAAAHVEEARRLRYDVEIHQRELDPVSLAVLKDERRRGTSVERSAFVSQPAEELAREGYVRVVNRGTRDEGTVFFAPDANVLLSDAFLDGHCFRMEERAAPSPELVGLAFEPVRRTRNADVAGVLWLDRRTSELKTLEFRYTSLPADMDAERLGGRVEFDRLETGEWFVRRWWIRMPVLGESVTHDRVAGATETFQRGGLLTLLKLREDGGTVLSTSVPSAGGNVPAVAAAAPAGRLEGTVWDSLAGAPLEGASVFVSGTQHVARSDAAGAFSLELPEGRYTVSFTHPGLAPLAITPSMREVEVRGGAPAQVRLGVPPLRTVAEGMCPPEEMRRYQGVVVGRALDAAGAPVPQAEVTAQWSRLTADRTGALVESAGTRADADGLFRLCGVPTDLALRTQAKGPAGQARMTLRLGGEPAVWQDVRISRSSSSPGDSAGRAVTLAGSAAPPRPAAALAAAPGRRAVADSLSGPVALESVEARAGASGGRIRGGGYLINRVDIDRRRPRNLTELLRGIPGAQVVPTREGDQALVFSSAPVVRGQLNLPAPTRPLGGSGSGGGSEGQGRGQGGDDARQTTGFEMQRGTPEAEQQHMCRVLLFVDGMPMSSGLGGTLNTELDPEIVERVEVYPRGTNAPPQYQRSGSECGVVLIWTRGKSPA